MDTLLFLHIATTVFLLTLVSAPFLVGYTMFKATITKPQKIAPTGCRLNVELLEKAFGKDL